MNNTFIMIEAERHDAELALIVATAAWEGGWTIRDCVRDDIEQAVNDGSDADINPPVIY